MSLDFKKVALLVDIKFVQTNDDYLLAVASEHLFDRFHNSQSTRVNGRPGQHR